MENSVRHYFSVENLIGFIKVFFSYLTAMRQKSIFLYRISSIGAVKQVFIIFILISIFLIFPEFFSYLKKSKIS